MKNNQSRINLCAGCTVGGGPAPRVPPTNFQFFTTLFWRLNDEQTFNVGLDITTTKKVVTYYGEEKCTPWENPGYAYEKRAHALRWYGTSVISVVIF